jgi:four helix bundle protein
MGFDHERLDVYRLGIEFVAWVGEQLEGRLRDAPRAATKHLDEASHSIVNNIAEGNGKRSLADRCRFLDIARGSALECAACLDTLVARKRLTPDEVAGAKKLLERIVSMLWRMVETLQPRSSSSTTKSTSTSASASTNPSGRGSRSSI